MSGPELQEPAVPIALFVFKRAEHTRRTLASLARNPEFMTSPLHVFCDGARSGAEAEAVRQTREVVAQCGHPDMTVTLQDTNQGLARSIITGVSALCAEYGRVIVMEDDLEVAPGFLAFMQAALAHYADDDRVMQVTGFAFDSGAEDTDTHLLPFISSWGWATWQRAWQHFDADAAGWQQLMVSRALRRRFDIDGCYPYSNMLLAQMRGEIDSWAIRWNWSVFCRQGLVVYPPRTLVSNTGFDGSGTHCSTVAEVNSDVQQAVLTYRMTPATEALGERDPARYRVLKRAVLHSRGAWHRRLARDVLSMLRRWQYRLGGMASSSGVSR